MTNANTLVIAKVVAFVAAAGLVISVFGIQANAQTTTTTTTTTSASSCASFNRDLTVGSTGADVTALQNWLISKGFTIAAGATGYFGSQTQAAVASYQASVNIHPAVGYFGPITRAQVNSVACAGGNTGGSTVPGCMPGAAYSSTTGAPCSGGSTGGDTDDDDDDSDELEGGEADLSDYEFNDEDSSGAEGEEEVEIATAEFDVEDGDVRVERLELTASSTGTGTASDRPWDYFETIYLWDADGDEIADIDASDRDEWDEGDDDVYTLTFNGLDHIVREGDRAEITIVADIANLDSEDITGGEFEFYIGDDGIRARDSEGIDHYIGDEDEEVVFSFDDEETGDLQIQSSADDPDATTLVADEDEESDEYTVFVFELENEEDVEVLLTDIIIDVDNSSSTQAIDDLIESATLVVDGEEIDGDISSAAGDGTIEFEDIDVVIGGEDTIDVELIITLAEGADGASLTFSVDSADVTAESDDTGEDTDVSGSATSETHTVATTGVIVDNGRTNVSVSTYNTTTGDQEGVYTITFDVEALDENVYIYRDAAATTTAEGGVVYNILQGGTASTTATAEADSLTSSESDNGDTSDYFLVRDGDTRTFTLQVVIDPVVSDFYAIELDLVRFDETEDNTSLDDESISVPDTSEFQTESRYVR